MFLFFSYLFVGVPMIHGSSVGVEHVMDWQNNVALLCSGGFSWRFVNTETGLSSAAVTANHARFLKLGTDDGDVFAPSSFSASVILGFSTLQKGKLILSAFSGENPFRALLVYPSAAIEVLLETKERRQKKKILMFVFLQ